MNHKAIWRWEQDGTGGEHGTATFFPDTAYEIAVTLSSFKEAFLLAGSIESAISQVRWDARRGLLNEIGRIEP